LLEQPVTKVVILLVGGTLLDILVIIVDITRKVQPVLKYMRWLLLVLVLRLLLLMLMVETVVFMLFGK